MQADLVRKAEASHELDRDEIAALLEGKGNDDMLFAAADRVRKKYVGDEVHLRGLIEFTNHCAQNCLYCGLRRDNSNLDRYRLEPGVIMEMASKAVSYGYRTLVLQAGEGNFYSLDEMLDLVRSIKKLDVAITLSIGEKSRDEYQAYREAGADRYLIRIETTDRELYEKMSPGMVFRNRIRCLRDLKELGYEVGTGCLVGLPGQTPESLADDIMFFREIEADMIGIGPFIPNFDTPLADAPGGSFEVSLRIIAVTRLLMPDINIPATTAMETIRETGRLIALQSGANVVMPNVTAGHYRRLYALYPGKICMEETPAHCRCCITNSIISAGRHVSEGYGYRKRVALSVSPRCII
jgi:biotin synthase